MQITINQERKLFMEYEKTGNIETASLKAGMTRKTGAKYLRLGRYQLEKTEHYWKTREDPFHLHWEEIEKMLKIEPALEAKTVFEWLMDKYPDSGYYEGQLRTLQRRMRDWRALAGPDKEIYFPQDHKPGRRMSTDFTYMNKLEITIRREKFPHLLCHSTLTYSNWEWATICHSESLLSLRHGVQTAFMRLGHIPDEHWTDHSTAATHTLGGDEKGERGFNRRYLEWMGYFKISPKTIRISKPNENGDVESLHGSLKNRIRQQLMLRGSKDFPDLESYRQFLEEILNRGNRRKEKRLKEELLAMRELQVELLPDYTEERPYVTCHSTIHVGKKIYSVPSRLIGEQVLAYLYEDHIDIFFNKTRQLSMARLRGPKCHAINYRHIIEWLIRKPGAFRDYCYREDLFPSLIFRKAYDRLCEFTSPVIADREYLHILRLAAKTMESTVSAVLADLESRGETPRLETVKSLCGFSDKPEIPVMEPYVVQLNSYDELIESMGVAS